MAPERPILSVLSSTQGSFAQFGHPNSRRSAIGVTQIGTSQVGLTQVWASPIYAIGFLVGIYCDFISIAIIVATRVRWLGVLHSLFAAFVAGCVMAVGILGLNLAFGGTIDPPFAWTTFALVLNGAHYCRCLYRGACSPWGHGYVAPARNSASSRVTLKEMPGVVPTGLH
jgi:hypothetical protein